MSHEPTLRVLSLGAGVQSTALLILAARGDLPRLDYAIFADTGWEPAAVYRHLDRIEREVARPAGIPILRVSAGNIRDDALDPGHRFASMPLYTKAAPGEPCPACGGSGDHPTSDQNHSCARKPTRDGACCRCGGDGKARDGIGRRQCTSEYKLKPLKRAVRELLGAPDVDGRASRVPAGRSVEQWIGISADESWRALDSKSTGYMPARWPLLERALSRADCMAVNTAAGFPDTPKSACIGCPFHRNPQWRDLRDNHPEEWADAVDFDRRIRGGPPGPTLRASRCGARCTCMRPACRSTRRRSTTSPAGSGATGRGTSSPSSRRWQWPRRWRTTPRCSAADRTPAASPVTRSRTTMR